MSCFMVHPAVRGRILSWLQRSGNGWILRPLCLNIDVDMQRVDWLEELDRRLWEMNAAAYSERYGVPEDGLEYDGLARVHHAGEMQTYKDLRCYLYQCAEGDVDQWALYRDLQIGADALAYEIISALPEYQNLAWDWDGKISGGG